jgi:hypothetical protein
MRRMHIVLLLAALVGLLIVGSALAMVSENYRIDWFVPFSGGGSRNMSSPGYAIDATYGQTAISAGASQNYLVGLGFWHGIIQGNIVLPTFTIQIPIVIKH